MFFSCCLLSDLVTKCDMSNGKVELNVIVEEASSQPEAELLANKQNNGEYLKGFISRMLRDSTPRYVGPSVGRLVGRSVGPLLFRRFLAF